MAERVRAALATLSSAPWRRAPLLLWRRPGVLAAVAGACAVMVASVSSVPVFLASVGSGSVAFQSAERCPRDTGVVEPLTVSPEEVRSPGPDPFAPLSDKLAPTNWWARVQLVTMASADGPGTTQASLLTRDDAADRLEILDGSDGPGVWITDRAAEATGLGVGDLARIGAAEVPVVAIYRDLSGNRVGPYWCSHASLLLIEVRGGDLVRPPPMVLADRHTFADIMVGLGVDAAEAGREAALAPNVTMGQAKQLLRQLACREQPSQPLRWCEDGQPLVAARNGDPRIAPTAARNDIDFVERVFNTHLPFVIARSRSIETTVGGAIWPVAAFATLAGAGLVAAAATLWFDRRRREVTLLTVRGVSPAGLGAKAVLEVSTALVTGALVGIGVAYASVVAVGPSSAIGSDVLGEMVGGAFLAVVVAACIVAAVVARRVRAGAARRRRLRFGAVPWEVLLLAWATTVSYDRLGDWGVPVGQGADVSRVDVWGLLFPILFLVTAVAAVNRVLSSTLRPLRSVSRAWPMALYLAVRRIARFRVAVLGLVAASAVAAGVFGYAATMNRSLEATLRAKATTFVGSDVAVQLPEGARLPGALVPRSTMVSVHWQAWVDDGGREGVTVVAIDPATFERAAFWDQTYADTSLSGVLDRLHAPAEEGHVPAVLQGLDIEGPRDAAIEDAGHTRSFVIEPVPGVETFPGVKRGRPTMFVDASALADLDLTGGRREAWIRGDRSDALAALQRAAVPFEEIRSVGEIADSSSFLVISWTFGYMQSLGIAAGMLVFGGVAVYLDARRRDRVLGHLFLRRMGMTRRQHRRALLLELTASVLVGCWTGLGIAVAGAWLAHRRIDPVPNFPPEPLLRPAVSVIVVVGAIALLTVAIGSVVAQRRMDDDDPLEVLRVGV